MCRRAHIQQRRGLASETFANSNVGGGLKGCYADAYDVRGQVTQTSEATGTTTCSVGTGYTTSAGYNDAGQLTSQTYPDGDVLTPTYDTASGWQNQLSVQIGGGAIALLASEIYSGAAGAMGLLTSATLGAMTGGTGSYSAGYDALGRLTYGLYSYTPSYVPLTLYQVQPTYDALGNVIENVTTLPQGVDTQVFCYDDLSRLTWAGSMGTPACAGAPTPSDTGGLVGSGAQYSAAYTYDSMNRLTSSPLGSYTYGASAHPDAATAIGSTWSAAYDPAGNTTCRAASGATTCAGTQTGAQLGYDNEGNLATWQNAPSAPTSTDSFLYDGEGNRVQQVAASGGTTTTTTYIGSLEEITAPSNAPASTTAYYGGLALSVSGTLSYTLGDQLGSVSEAVSTSGSVTATQLYGPYGAVRYSSGSLPGTLAYTGQHADATTGLDYYNARYYDPLAGQFGSADTIYAGGVNLFGYVGGSPETFTDPTGHDEAPPNDRPNGGPVVGVGIDLGELFSWITEQVVRFVTWVGAGIATAWTAISLYWDSSQSNASSPSASSASGPATIGATYADQFAVPWAPIYAINQSDEPTPPPSPTSPPGSNNNGVTITPAPPSPPQPSSSGAASGGGRKVCGGAYDKVPKNGGENHHMPADSVSPFSTGKGPVINMPIKDHRITASWGSSDEAQAYREVQRGLIEDGHFEEAQRLDIENVRFLFGAKYDEAIDQMLQYTNDLLSCPPEDNE